MSKFLLDAQHGQLHGTAKSTAVTVSGGPTLLPADPLKQRKDFNLFNSSPNMIWVGGPDVTYDDGFPVPAGQAFHIAGGRLGIYAVVSGTNQTVRVLEAS